MPERLSKILTELGIVSDDSRQQFIQKTSIKTFPKNAIIFSENKPNNSEFLLIEGVLHRFNETDKGDLVTTGFYLNQTVITPHFARIRNNKSIFSLQALTEIIIAEIPVNELDYLRHTNQEFARFGQNVVEKELSKTFFYQSIERSYSAKERLLILRSEYRNLENLIPHNIIASYLGITNVSFSRLRKEMATR